MRHKRFSFILGFSVWLIGTTLFSLWGDKFFITNNILIMSALYLAVIPAMYAIVAAFSAKFKLNKHHFTESIILMAIPGLVLDTFVFKYYDVFFPKLELTQAASLGSFVIWIYGILLIIGILIKPENKKPLEG